MEKRIIEYVMLGYHDHEMLGIEVQRMIEMGWEPYGQAFVAHYGFHRIYQAVIKRGEG